MPQKKHKPEEIVAKLRQVDVLLSQGKSVGEAVRTIGVTQFGDAAGSALLFNMEKLFETVLGLRIRRACQVQAGARLTVGLQSPVKNLATAGFQLRPDITVQSGDEYVAIFDAKWKRLDLAEPNSGVSSADAYQMNAYASRYRGKRLALVYPASRDCPPGRITEFVLMTEERPVLDVVAVDVRELAFRDVAKPSCRSRPPPSF